MRKYLEAIGFKANPDDPCVANNMVRDKKLMLNCQVNDLNVSRADKYIFDAFIQRNKNTYEDVKKFKPSRGKIHDYIVMVMDYTTSGEVKNYMK